MLEEIKTYEFISSVGILSILTSVLTLIIMFIVKMILRKTNVINNETDALKKDVILSRIGRIICILIFISLYVLDVILVKHLKITIDVKLFSSLISGIISTLIVTKGLYTMIRQMEKKESVYEKLEVANNTIKELEILVNSYDKKTSEASKEDIIKKFWPMNDEVDSNGK